MIAPASLGETFTIFDKDLDVSGGVSDMSITESTEENPMSPDPQISSLNTPESQIYEIPGFTQTLTTDLDSFSELDSSSKKPLRFRVLKDIYELVETEVPALCLLALEEPTRFEAAVKERSWRLAIEEQMRSIRDNETWELVELPADQKAIG